MFKIRNTEITDKRGFPQPCYVATATQNLNDFRNSSLWTSSHMKEVYKAKIKLLMILA